MVLRISPTQMAAMRRIWVTPVVDALLGSLQSTHAPRLRSLGPERSRRLLSEAVLTARRHDLESREGLGAYVALVLSIGEDLGHPEALGWSSVVLDDPWLSPAEKVEQLEQLAQERGMLAR